MLLNERNPAAVAPAAGSQGIHVFIDNETDSPSDPFPQAAFISRKYHLTPVWARLVCDLANIGERCR